MKLHKYIKENNVNKYLKNIQEIYPRKDYEVNSVSLETLENQLGTIFALEYPDSAAKQVGLYFDLAKENKLRLTLSAVDRTIMQLYTKQGLQLDEEWAEGYYSYVREAFWKSPQDYVAGLVSLKSPTRRMGEDFKKYFLNTEVGCSLDEFKDIDGAALIVDSDERLKTYLKDTYNLKLNKGVDAIGRGASGALYVLEAKYISQQGGAQNHQIKDALSKVAINDEVNGQKIKGLAVLDGLLAIPDAMTSSLLEDVSEIEQVVSATELIEFLKNN